MIRTAFMLVLLAGCGTAPEAPQVEPTPTEATAKAPEAAAEGAMDVKATLAAADKHDGAEDHVVSECTGCSLHMAGSKKHTVSVDDYTLHFCSDSCKGKFEADQESGLANLSKAVN